MNKKVSRCQCLPTCKKPCIKGEAFCEEHMELCPRRSPVNGSEPAYDPDRWNLERAIRLTHNCFSYAMNIMDPRQIKACLESEDCDVPFHQPGSVSGWPRFNDTDPKTCPNIIARLMGDNPKDQNGYEGVLQPVQFEQACEPGRSKIALVIDEDQDYHFLRQDAPDMNDPIQAKQASIGPIGYFSQKSGALPVTDKDAKGNKIFDVVLAYHNFTKHKSDPLNYDRFCGYFCVPRNRPLFIKIGGKRYRYSRRK